MNKHETLEILVVDDSRFFTRFLGDVLRELGYAVAGTAASGREAVELAERLRPDLVLMDIVLDGDIDGIEAAGAVSAMGIPVIYLSAHAGGETLRKATETAPYGYVLKDDYSKASFVQSVRTTIEVGYGLWQAQQDLRRQQGLMASTLDALDEGVFTLDSQGRLVALNPAGESLLGFSQSEVRGYSLLDVITLLAGDERLRPGKGEPPEEALQRFLDAGSSLELRSRDGRRFPVEGTLKGISAGEGDGGYVLVLRDISELRKTREKLHRMAYYDGLTGLPNRTSFNEQAERMVRCAASEGFPAALMVIDFDNFKEINDTMGHAAGDRLLTESARGFLRISRTRRRFYRLGGDEFAVLLTAADDLADLRRPAEMILGLFDRRFSLRGREVSMSASIGVARFPDDARTVEELFRKADKAMYRAKDAGGNSCCLVSTDEVYRYQGQPGAAPK
ncbi:MAG: diguanylate cyclase [Synergistales bacterium]|nr:diguanylate cyclase [Synergistales bacterium]